MSKSLAIMQVSLAVMKAFNKCSRRMMELEAQKRRLERIDQGLRNEDFVKIEQIQALLDAVELKQARLARLKQRADVIPEDASQEVLDGFWNELESLLEGEKK